ncbi:MAG: hypothetical protein Fur0035_05560 [Anaerolineales bacterium]
MRERKLRPWLFMALMAACLTGAWLAYLTAHPARQEMREEIYPCVVYYRRVHNAPRPLVAHIVTVDLSCKNISTFITPPDRKNREAEFPLNARTTSQFAREFGVQIAINGDGFTPWWSNSPWDYYPHSGDPVKPNGFAASAQKQYGAENSAIPTLYINRQGTASFGKPQRGVYNAISGSTWLVRKRQLVKSLAEGEVAPRTAVGLDGPGTRLILIVVDGRQPFYSEGATIAELAELMLFYGGDNAMLLDGGGSSTLVIDWPQKGLQVINSPIDLYLPGRERPVANHLGIFVR